MSSNSDMEIDVSQNNSKRDEIDLKLIFNFLNRNKKFLSLISVVFFIIGYLASAFPKRTWGGEFQIVLSSDMKSNGLSDLSPLRSLDFSSIVDGPNTLETEVGILGSPSVLMPVYEEIIVKNDNIQNKNYAFSKWRKTKLNIELEKGTSILNIFYKDKNKSNILPVLEKISYSYQDYSSKRKEKDNENSQEYLVNQLNLFREKSAKSLKLAQEYAIEKDLVFFDNLNRNQNVLSSVVLPSISPGSSPIAMAGQSPTTYFNPSNVDIEQVRVQAANEIRRIDMQLEKIDQFKDPNFEYVGSTIPELIKAEFLTSLRRIDSEIAEVSSKYTDEDASVKRLKEKREHTIKQLKERSINYLKAKKLDAEARMEASARPKEVLIKYKELVRNAGRDEDIYIKLEDQLRTLELSKARKEIPWELITKPTILNRPVDNLRLNFSLFALFSALSTSIIYLYAKEKRSDIIFELKDLIKLISTEFLEIINVNEIQSSVYKVDCLREFIGKEPTRKIKIYSIGKIEENKVQIIKEYLFRNQKIKNNFEFVKSIKDLYNENKEKNFLLLEFGSVTYKEINNFIKYQKIFNVDLDGTIILERGNFTI